MDPVDWGGGAAEVDMAGLLKPLSPLEAAVPFLPISRIVY